MYIDVVSGAYDQGFSLKGRKKYKFINKLEENGISPILRPAVSNFFTHFTLTGVVAILISAALVTAFFFALAMVTFPAWIADVSFDTLFVLEATIAVLGGIVTKFLWRQWCDLRQYWWRTIGVARNATSFGFRRKSERGTPPEDIPPDVQGIKKRIETLARHAQFVVCIRGNKRFLAVTDDTDGVFLRRVYVAEWQPA